MSDSARQDLMFGPAGGGGEVVAEPGGEVVEPGLAEGGADDGVGA